MSEQKLQARVYSRTAPTEEQLAQLRDFLHQKYQRPVSLHWERDDRMKDGFRLELGEGESRELVYDWSSSGKSRQLKDKIAAAIRSRSDVIPLLRKTLEDFQPEASATEIGTVLSYGDGIAEVSGLPVADDKFALAAADGEHRIDGQKPRLHGLVDRLPVDDAGGRGFNGILV